MLAGLDSRFAALALETPALMHGLQRVAISCDRSEHSGCCCEVAQAAALRQPPNECVPLISALTPTRRLVIPSLEASGEGRFVLVPCRQQCI